MTCLKRRGSLQGPLAVKFTRVDGIFSRMLHLPADLFAQHVPDREPHCQEAIAESWHVVVCARRQRAECKMSSLRCNMSQKDELQGVGLRTCSSMFPNACGNSSRLQRWANSKRLQSCQTGRDRSPWPQTAPGAGEGIGGQDGPSV